MITNKFRHAPRGLYFANHREHVLSPEQVLSCLHISDEAIIEIQLIVENEMKSNQYTKTLFLEDNLHELLIAKALILKTMQAKIQKIHSL